MKILDTNGNEITDVDLSKGYLIQEEITIHHEAVPPVKEIGHYEVIKEYPNGGKDVEWVVDQEGIEGKDAYDETEIIERYILYTENELKEREIAELNNMIQNNILELKGTLMETDYIVIKIAEGVATWDEYPDIKELRQHCREKINELEDQLIAPTE